MSEKEYKHHGGAKRQKGETKGKSKRGYVSGSTPSPRSSSSGVPASPSRGVVPSSSRSSPSLEGGMNSTSSGSQPSVSAHWRSSIGRRPQNGCPPGSRGPMSSRPYVGILRSPHSTAASASAFASAALAFESASLNRICRSFFSASQVSFSSLNFSQRCLYLAVAFSDLWHSDVDFIARARACEAIHKELIDDQVCEIENDKLGKEEGRGRTLYLPRPRPLLSVTLGCSEVPDVAKSHDLARSHSSSNLAAELATRKFLGHTLALAAVSPTGQQSHLRSLWGTVRSLGN
ncbi:LOW QUALITY PROTEIN: hypothetical protein Cgig2_017472 [Carnegiea gigantea]|uniref:Uncharacterized protein n=1 Tax=Carnegiea gigantea TaxID=171969 RepID=A0A9Q1JL68_9CARY|nr:LOW QUALITY PROTEIN: hypothetical protein Cgig2_017472 [Carnegiea gigantea]